jgi:hypothetical protein
MLKILLISMSLISCSVYTPWVQKEEMLPDGKTWKITKLIDNLCEPPKPSIFTSSAIKEYKSAQDDCINKAMPLIQESSTELCGQSPERIFSCKLSDLNQAQTNNPQTVSCYAKCK